MAERKIVVLVEDTAGGRGLLAEHGLAFCIRLGRRRILFDTGQGRVLEHNAFRLGLGWDAVGDIVISHGHYDHTGGLSGVLARAGKTRVHIHPAALAPKYARGIDGAFHPVGIPAPGDRDVLAGADMSWAVEPADLGDGLWITGPVPRTNDFEDPGGPFFKDPRGFEPDDFPDDQAAFLETPTGTVVILGCAHAGVINTLDYIRTLTSNRPFRAVMGGMHLVSAGPDRLKKTIDGFRRLGVERLVPCHCTGFKAAALLWNEWPGRCSVCPTGAVLEFP